MIQLPSPCIIHSFVRFLNSLQPLLFRYITAKMERLSRKEEHLVTENLAIPTWHIVLVANANWIGKWEREKMVEEKEEELATHLIAMLFAFKWCHRWFISSSRRCSITASSWLAKELNSFLPVPFNDVYTSRCVSISDCRSCNNKNIVLLLIKYSERYELILRGNIRLICYQINIFILWIKILTLPITTIRATI